MICVYTQEAAGGARMFYVYRLERGRRKVMVDERIIYFKDPRKFVVPVRE